MKKLLILFVSIALVSCQKTKTDETPAPSEQEASDNCQKIDYKIRKDSIGIYMLHQGFYFLKSGKT